MINNRNVQSDIWIIKKHYKVFFDLSISSLIGAINLQLDKFIVALFLSKLNFAIYLIASTIYRTIQIKFIPFFSTSLPKFLEFSIIKM